MEISKEDFMKAGGRELGTSDWIEIDQKRINEFADVTLDHQFIHIDPEAAAKTPFGGTVAHGFLSLSLLPYLMKDLVLTLPNVVMGVNYGFNSLRFLSPVPVNSKVRANVQVKEVVEKNPNQYLITYSVVLEIDGVVKPALVAEWLTMLFTG
ncbi:MAG: MaoC family dehydratase [Robiginitomaculum sp.]|nr:MaoC family dehydratase [Robiginitomaculum sp.]